MGASFRLSACSPEEGVKTSRLEQSIRIVAFSCRPIGAAGFGADMPGEQEEERADFITPLGSAPPSGVRPYRVLTNEQGEAFVLTSSPDAGGSQHEYVSLTDWIEFASKSI